MQDPPTIDAVVIGRNEGDRLLACLDSLHSDVRRIIYVDSGSTDGSVTGAQARGAEVIELQSTLPFTAARARNAGLAQLGDDTDFVQFVDGDCAVRPGWIAAGSAFLHDHPETAVVCGRRRERHPESSVYNGLADAEWDTAIGQARFCGGDALMRVSALRAVGGYRDDLIAGEEPELCVRLRQAGWAIWRVDQEMTWHDAQMTRFGQWWRRTRRAGYAYAEGATLHGGPPEYHWVRETQRALVWGAALPLAVVLGGMIWSPLWGLALAYPAQVVRLSAAIGGRRAAFYVLGKIPEALGALGFYLDRATGKKRHIIEYR